MKVFILALDGLEYDLVKLWNLSGLKQKAYGRIELREMYFHPEAKVPWTPYIWSSFISGKHQDVKIVFTYGKIIDRLRKHPLFRWIKGKRRLFWRIGLTPKAEQIGRIKEQTIFDSVSPSIAIDVPTYNEPLEHWKIHELIWTKGIETYENKILKIFNEKRKKVFLSVTEEWKLFMAYFKIADLAGHIYICKRLGKLRKIYEDLNNLTFKLKGRLSENSVFLIVSDHGMIPSDDGVSGTHSTHAFWSLNIKTNWKPKDITDFHPKILEWIESDLPNAQNTFS